MRLVYLTLCAACQGCATTQSPPPEPIIRTVEIKVATPVPCKALEKLGPEPTYPDTDAAIAEAKTPGALAKLYVNGRVMRIQRLAEYSIAKASCLF